MRKPTITTTGPNGSESPAAPQQDWIDDPEQTSYPQPALRCSSIRVIIGEEREGLECGSWAGNESLSPSIGAVQCSSVWWLRALAGVHLSLGLGRAREALRGLETCLDFGSSLIFSNPFLFC